MTTVIVILVVLFLLGGGSVAKGAASAAKGVDAAFTGCGCLVFILVFLLLQFLN